MTQGDEEHLAFEEYCKFANLNTDMHPIHFLYLDIKTCNALDAFKAGRLSVKDKN